MTGFDPTAPSRDTDQDAREEVPGNVVPPETLTGGDESSETSDPEPETHGEH